ncbi:mucin-3A isoform X1 [Nematostella vectensis]|uniref:mucin-3A isoform X1 n=1 Tax=Nematostella vectensis TaxID=45351 RepID=UPI0020771D26|nr:mucin-3A isoform X1 [Nematostella vectensis]
MTTDSCVSCLKKQSFTCNERKCYETSTTFDKRTMEQYCSRRPFIKCTPWKRKLQYNKTSTVSWSPAHSDKSQDYCLLPEMSLPSSVNNRLLVTAVYIIFTSILRTINTHISTQQTTRVLVFVLAISALLSGCGPYVTAESTSLSPGSQPQLELPNAITYVGMAFIYKIPSKIFNCKLDYIEISEGSSRTLPNWLAYDEHKQELYGVPSMEDIGTSYILIVAIADDSLHTGRICGMKSFTINVVAVHHQPHASVIMMASSVALESQVLHFGSGRMNENLFCTPGAQLILGTILLSANLQQVSGHERMMILNKTAQHLKVTTEKMALFSGEVDHPLVSQLKDPSVIKSGAGDGRYSKGKRSLLTWALGCGALKLNSDLLDLETSSKDGTISMLLGHPVIGWHVTSGVQRARHRGRRAILPATPTPTETSMLPTQVKSILTTVLTGSMTLMPTIIQNSTEVLQSSAVASLNVTTIVSATPSFTLSASLSIKPTVILNSTVVVNATINMSSLASSAILVYSTTSPLMNASSEASLTSTEVVNTSSVQPSSSISMTSIMQTDTMNTTFSIQPTPSINVTTVSIEMTSIMPTETMNTTLSLLPDPSINVTNVKSPSLTTSGLLQPSLSANVTTELSKPVNTSFFPQPTPSTNMSSSEVLLSWNSSIMLTPSESANISKMPSSTVSLPGNSSIMETIKVTPTSSLTTPQNTSVVFTNSTVQDTLVLYTSSTPVLNISSGWNSTIVKESTTTLLLSSSSVPLNESTSNVSVAINSTVQASTTIYSLPPTSMLNSTPATVSIDSIAPSPTTPPSSSSTTITTLNASVMATATPSASLETNASTMLSSGISVPSIDSTVLPDSSSFIPTVTTVVQTGSSDMNRTSSITPSFQTASIWTGTPMLTTDIVEPTINASRTSMTTIVSSASGSSVYSAFSINTTDTTLLISKSLRTTETVSMTTSINVSSTILSLLPSIVTSPIMTSVNMSSASIVNSSSIEVVDSCNTENSTLSAYVKDAMTNNVTLSTAKLPHSLGSLSPSTPISPSVVEDFVNNSTRLETIYISADVNFSLRDATAASLVSIVTGTAGPGSTLSRTVVLTLSSVTQAITYSTISTESFVTPTSLVNDSTIFASSPVDVTPALSTKSFTSISLDSTRTSTLSASVDETSTSIKLNSSVVKTSLLTSSLWQNSLANSTLGKGLITTVLSTSSIITHPNSTAFVSSLAIQTSILVVKSSVETSIIGKSTTIANVSSILPSPSTVYMETTSVPDNYTEVTTTHDAASSTTWSVPDIYMTLSITTGVYTSLSSPGIKNTTFTPSEIVSPSISTLHTSTVEVSSTGNVSMLTLKTNSIPVTSPAPSTSLPASSTLPVLPTSSLADTPSTQSVASSGVMVTFSSVAAVNSSTISADITSLISSSSLNISSAYVLSTGVLPGTTSKQSMIQPITSTSFTTTSVLFESSADVSSSSIAFDITSILSTSVLPETTSIQSTMQPNTSTSSPTTSVLFESSADVSSSSIALDITSILSTSVLPETTSIQSTMQPNTSTSSPTTSVLFESSADVSSSSIALDITSILSTSVLPETTSIQSTMQPNTSTVLSSVDSVDSSSVVESSQSRTAATINSTTQESSSFQTSIYPSQSSIFRTSVLPSSYFSSTVIVETSSSSASSLAPSPTATTTSILQTTEPSSTPPTSPALTVTMTTVIATDSSITPTTVTKVIPTSTATVVIPPDLVVVNDIGRVTVTSGKVFNYQVPADTFHDRKDGNTRNLTLELYLVGPQSTQAEIPGWLQFDDKTQTISGLPMDPSETLTRGELFILKARNSRGDIAYDAFEILVLDSQTQHAVELSTRLDNNYTIFSNNLTQRLLLLSAIASFYGDASPGYIRVLRYQEGSVLFIWTNDTLPTSECDPEKNARVSNRVEEDGEVTNAFRQALAPRFPVMSAYSSLVGVCNRTIIPASAIPGARDSEESSDLWVKHVLPGVLVAFILIIIAILLFLYLRRKRPKPADPERRTYKKRKPIILDPEMELKPLPGKPLVLPSDDPSQPPSYISDTSLDKAPYSYYNDDYDDDGDDEEDFKFGSFPPSPIYETPPPVYGGFEPDYRETPPPNYRLPPMYLNYTVPPWETSSDV